MKNSIIPWVAAFALAVVLFADPASRALAQGAAETAGAALADPVGMSCVVTLDPASTNDLAGTTGIRARSGVTSGNLTEGILVRMDSEWVVVKEGSYENWIPAGKVLMMRISR